MPKAIIIITDALTAPLYTPRVRFLNQRLIADGHDVVWYAEQSPTPIPDDIRPKNLIEIPYYRSKLDRILKAPLIFLFDHKNRYFAKQILSQRHNSQLVFVSTFHTFGLQAGLKIAKHNNCKLHIDLRDIAEQTPANSYSRSFLSGARLYRKINIARRNRILRQADTLTTVSHFHQQLLSKINPNTHLIYNGYDANIFKPMPKPEARPIRIVYTGRWYGREMQDPTPLFKALGGADFEYELIFYTAPDVHDELRQMANEYGVKITLNSYVPNSEIPGILNNAHVALVLTSPRNKGVLTTKFFEAIGTATLVLCAPSDEGELAELIKTTKTGLASSEPEEIRDFLTSLSSDSSLTSISNLTSEFSRQYQTEKLCSLF